MAIPASTLIKVTTMISSMIVKPDCDAGGCCPAVEFDAA
jgi:hypothetical protein